MKLAECPIHGRDFLANAGAVCFVRCLVGGCPHTILERCPRCKGTGVDCVEADWLGCSSCSSAGWRPRLGSLGTVYVVS